MSTPDRDNDLVGFSRRDAERIAAAVKRDERRYQNPPPSRAKWGASPLQVIPAKNGGTQVSAGSTTTPISFTATLLIPSGSGAALTTTTETVTAYNAYPGTIAANALVFLVVFNGLYYVLGASCS